MRRAVEAFPLREMAERVWQRYFVPGGKPVDQPFRGTTLVTHEPPRHLLELLVTANFAEVFLAMERQPGLVGINYLEKIQLPTLPSIFGAMLAGVHFVIMGAGIPRAIPGILDQLAVGEGVELPLHLVDAEPGQKLISRFDPKEFWGGTAPMLTRPSFFGIVSSAPLASMLARKSSGRVDGFIVEGPSAGGHNAPPRGAMQLDAQGEPIYGERDVIDLAALRELGLPFWIAGSVASPEGLRQSLAQGAVGIQVGTAFAFCEESGIAPELKRRVLARFFPPETGDEGSGVDAPAVRTDPLASPTGFPFKVLPLAETMASTTSEPARTRVCDLGYLREAYNRGDGKIGYRCPAESVELYVRKGGAEAATEGRLCVCNGLMATIGLGQVRNDGYRELPLVTSGDALEAIRPFLAPGAQSYKAADVVAGLLAGQTEPGSGAHGAGNPVLTV